VGWDPLDPPCWTTGMIDPAHSQSYSNADQLLYQAKGLKLRSQPNLNSPIRFLFYYYYYYYWDVDCREASTVLRYVTNDEPLGARTINSVMPSDVACHAGHHHQQPWPGTLAQRHPSLSSPWGRGRHAARPAVASFLTLVL
jgi:hypothetical protein